MKRIIPILLTLLIVFSSFSTIFAENTEERYDIKNTISKALEDLLNKRMSIYIDRSKDISLVQNIYNRDIINEINLDYKLNQIINNGNKHLKKHQDFGERIRKAKEVTGRDYYKSQTTLTVNNIKELQDSVYEVQATEITKLYFKSYENPEDFEAYKEEHIFTIVLKNNKIAILDDNMPNSYIYTEYDGLKNNVQVPSDEKKVPSQTFTTNKLTSIQTLTTTAYDGQKAADYADQYWSSYNTLVYRTFDNDCTNFVSQSIKYGLNGTQDTSGTYLWFYVWPGLLNGIGYSASWGSAYQSYDYWYIRQVYTTKYMQTFTVVPTQFTELPSTHPIWNYAEPGMPVYYHTDPNATVYYNHAGIIVGKIGTLNDFGDLITWRPIVDCHTNNRYHVDYTLYPYLDYQGMIDIGYEPALTIVNIPNFTPND